MKLFVLMDQYHKIEEFIINEKTGTPKEFAAKMQISLRTLYKRLEELKDFGAPIKYSRERETYYFSSPYALDLKEVGLKRNKKPLNRMASYF